MTLSLTLALSGCSYHYGLQAVALEGRVAFVPQKAKNTGCFSEFKVTGEAGEVIWELEAGQYLPPPCENKFPIIYGSAPRGMTETVKARPLRDGVLYRAEGWDGDSYSGAFRVRGRAGVDNLETAE